MAIQTKPITLLPNEKSTADDWVIFYKSLRENYGEKAANYAFVKRWSLRRGNVSAVDVEKGTGLTLNKSFLEGVEKTADNAVDYVGGFFNTIGTGGKVVFYAGIGLSVFLVGGVIYRLVTLSASEAGTVAGTAAKVYTGKP
jgi:hypothetical protein